MLALLERKGILYAQKAVLGLLALVSLLVGVVFLTIAAWIYLASVTNAVAASLIMGAIFVILALLLLIMSMRRGRRYVMPTAAPVTASAIVKSTNIDMIDGSYSRPLSQEGANRWGSQQLRFHKHV